MNILLEAQEWETFSMRYWARIVDGKLTSISSSLRFPAERVASNKKTIVGRWVNRNAQNICKAEACHKTSL